MTQTPDGDIIRTALRECVARDAEHAATAVRAAAGILLPHCGHADIDAIYRRIMRETDELRRLAAERRAEP